MIRAFLYNAEGHDREVAMQDVVIGSLTDQNLLWVDLEDAGDEEQRQVASLLGIERSKSLGCNQDLDAPRLQTFGDYITIYLSLPRTNERVLRDKANKSLLGRIVTLRRKNARLRVALAANRPVFYGYRDLIAPSCRNRMRRQITRC